VSACNNLLRWCTVSAGHETVELLKAKT